MQQITSEKIIKKQEYFIGKKKVVNCKIANCVLSPKNKDKTTVLLKSFFKNLGLATFLKIKLNTVKPKINKGVITSCQQQRIC